jgi:NAD(P)-binding Rossmann-like domain
MDQLSRRDFLNGIALTIASGLTPAEQLAADPRRYPPALTGLRGQHPGSFEVAHEFARAGKRYVVDDLAPEESYDLIVVGGGISGLAAAWFYRRAVGADARILVLDNHDDFGGHAKRNEFILDQRLLIGYGGSQSIQSPKTLYSPVAKALLRDLGVDVGRFESAFDRSLYSSLGLSRGVFFAREAFRRDALVPGDALLMSANELARNPGNEHSLREFIAACPLSDASKGQLLALYDRTRDPLSVHSEVEKHQLLKTTSYRDYLTKICGCSEEVANCFQGRTLGFFGLGCDAVPAAERSGFRLSGVCDAGDKVLLSYVRAGAPHRIAAQHVVLACFHMMIPHIMPDLPQAQREALARNVKTPLVYTNVLVRNWRPWMTLKIHQISAPMSFHCHVALDFPVSLGVYKHSRDPDEPIVLHLVHVPGAPNSGLDARSQFRIGASKLLDMTFAAFEKRIHDELDRMLGPGGFDSARDIAAITVNRWPHGYGYVANSLFDGENYAETVKLARTTVGRIGIANSDAAGDAYAHLAIDQAERAVRELLQ